MRKWNFSGSQDDFPCWGHTQAKPRAGPALCRAVTLAAWPSGAAPALREHHRWDLGLQTHGCCPMALGKRSALTRSLQATVLSQTEPKPQAQALINFALGMAVD